MTENLGQSLGSVCIGLGICHFMFYFIFSSNTQRPFVIEMARKVVLLRSTVLQYIILCVWMINDLLTFKSHMHGFICTGLGFQLRLLLLFITS